MSMSGLKRALLLLRHTARTGQVPAVSPSPLIEQAMEQEKQLYVSDYLAGLEDRQQTFQEIFAPVMPDSIQPLPQETQIGRSELDEISRRLEDQRQQVLQINGELQSVVAGQRRTRTEVRRWLQAARQARDLIEQNYAHDFFAPGELEKIDHSLGMAEGNARAGACEAALLGAQQSCLALNDLRLKLESQQAEWAYWYHETHQKLVSLAAAIERCRSVAAVDQDDREIPGAAIDVDAWTNGRLSQLLRAVNVLDGQMQNATMDMLKTAAKNRLPELEKRLLRLVDEARSAVLGSQARVNICDLVVSSLQGNGYQLQGAEYETGDMRGEYAARLIGADGSQVVVRVSPTGRGQDKQELILETTQPENAAYTEYELQRRADEISQALNRHGIEGQLSAGGILADQREESRSVPGTVCAV